MIKDAGYSYQKVADRNDAFWLFDGTGDNANSIYCVEHNANWKAKDGSSVRWVSLR